MLGFALPSHKWTFCVIWSLDKRIWFCFAYFHGHWCNDSLVLMLFLLVSFHYTPPRCLWGKMSCFDDRGLAPVIIPVNRTLSSRKQRFIKPQKALFFTDENLSYSAVFVDMRTIILLILCEKPYYCHMLSGIVEIDEHKRHPRRSHDNHISHNWQSDIKTLNNEFLLGHRSELWNSSLSKVFILCQ
jgi:hypothetical protein